MSRGSRAIALIVAGLFAWACSKTPVDPNVASWRVLPGHVESFRHAGFRAGRQCWVYLPPSYQLSSDRYPVLYVTDGEDVFDGGGQMHVNRICEDLIRKGEIRPIIVVAIENASRDLRFWELTPWTDDDFYDGEGGGGAQFVEGIRDTLKPAIDRRYRTLRDAASTAIAGVSLGGVLAAYAGIAHSETFGNVAAFSPSYWLRSGYIAPFADSVSHVRYLPGAIRRFYQDTGTSGDNYIAFMETHLLTYGFSSGVDFLSVTVVGGIHYYGAWEHRYPEMLKFLFGTN